MIRPALFPQWGLVVPFALRSGDQFRPPAPPPLTSSQYATEWKEVKALGSKDSAIRTPDQTRTAQFWGYGPGTATPPGHWNQVARAVLQSNACTANCTESNARMFALLNIALADAAIISWDAKYVYDYWRPITAIREADTDGNPDTELDPAWSPYLETPPFPEYTSGHSTFSGAAATVLTYTFGSDRIPFSVGSDDIPGYTLSYDSFSQAALESGKSRIYGGIHFSAANVHGLSTGSAVGSYVAWNLMTPLEGSPDPQASLLAVAIKLDPPSLAVGGFFSATASGAGIVSETFFDIRFRAPGSSVDQEGLNWQRGGSATHTIPTGTRTGLWTITGVRAHQNEADHTGSYVPVSIGLQVSPGN